MTAHEDLLKAFVDAMQDADWHMTADEDYVEADRLIREAIDEAIKSYADVLHFTGRPAPAESGYARDQLIIAFRGGEEDEFCRYGWDAAVMMADRVVASLRAEIRDEVLRDAAAKIRSYSDPPDDWAANLIDPDRQEIT